MNSKSNQWICTLCDYVIVVPDHFASASIIPQLPPELSCGGCSAPCDIYFIREEFPVAANFPNLTSDNDSNHSVENELGEAFLQNISARQRDTVAGAVYAA